MAVKFWSVSRDLHSATEALKRPPVVPPEEGGRHSEARAVPPQAAFAIMALQGAL